MAFFRVITKMLVSIIMGLILCLFAMVGLPEITSNITGFLFDDDQVKDKKKGPSKSKNIYQIIKDKIFNSISSYCQEFVDLESQKNYLYEKMERLSTKWQRTFDTKKSEIVSELKAMDFKGIKKTRKKVYRQASKLKKQMKTDISKIITSEDTTKLRNAVSSWFCWFAALICDFGVQKLTMAKNALSPENPKIVYEAMKPLK